MPSIREKPMDSDSTAEPIVETPQVAENTDGVNSEYVAPDNTPEFAPAEPSFEELISQFERENAPASEPVSEPILGATEAAPAEPETAQPDPLSDPVQRIFDDASASDALRQEAAQLDAARQ